jgi:hypothetical protein
MLAPLTLADEASIAEVDGKVMSAFIRAVKPLTAGA